MFKHALKFLSIVLLFAPLHAYSVDSVVGILEKAISNEGINNIRITNTRVAVNGGYSPLSRVDAGKFIFSSISVDEKNRKFEALFDNDIKIHGRYEKVLEVPALSHRLYRGDLIKDGDVEWVKISEKKLNKNTVLRPKQLIGKVVTRRIASGKPISKRDIAKPLLVKKGNLVTMIYETPLIRLKTIGYALENGADGEIIRIKNAKSGSIITAMVNDGGKVIVNHGRPL